MIILNKWLIKSTQKNSVKNNIIPLIPKHRSWFKFSNIQWHNLYLSLWQTYNFDFDIESFPFLGGDVPPVTSYSVYISQLIHFAKASSQISDFYNWNTAKLLNVYSRGTIPVS